MLTLIGVIAHQQFHSGSQGDCPHVILITSPSPCINSFGLASRTLCEHHAAYSETVLPARCLMMFSLTLACICCKKNQTSCERGTVLTFVDLAPHRKSHKNHCLASFATHFEGIRPFCREYEYLSQQLNKK